MLVLLPPSEGKSSGGDGPPVDIAALSWPSLTSKRERAAGALVALCRGNPKRARDRLGLSEALDDDRVSNAVLLDSPTLPAGRRYAGVLHDALGYPTLAAAGRRRADAALVVFSGLWGVTRPTDAIPAYRIGIATQLPRIGPLPAYWRMPLAVALDEAVGTDGALDLRSSGYAPMYRPSPAAAEGVVSVRITGPDGGRAAASYQSKVAKGRLVREMLALGTPSVDRLLTAAVRIGVTAEVIDTRVVVRLPAGWGLVGSAPLG